MEPPSQTPSLPVEPIAWRRIGISTAVVSGVFSLIVLALLVVNYFQGKAVNPLNNPQLAELKAKLTESPSEEPLKIQIRTLDLDLRKKHFRHVALAQYGTWLLIGGAIVFLATIKPATNRKKLPKPQKRTPEEHAREVARTRWAVAVFGVALAGAGWLAVPRAITQANTTPALSVAPQTAAAPAPVAPTAAAFPTTEELSRNWPRFRGPGGAGISAYTNVPTAWNAKTGEGILWKTETPISGPSSPVIWGDHIFLIGANATTREVYCFDTSGRLLWQKPVDPKRESAEAPTVMEDTGGYAPSTPCTDGLRVYAIYANGDVAAFDFAGNPVWARNIGRPDNTYGHASSLEMYKNRLLIQFDQGASAKDNKSKILALDSATGQTAWESAPRPVPNSWSTPILINNGQRDLLITCGNPWVIAHDPTDGKEIWRAKAMYGEVLPSPVYSAGFVYTAMEGEKLYAIPATGAGDVTSNVAWSADDGLPDIVSPLCDGQRIYLVTSAGTLTCYETKTGKKLWEKDLEQTIKSSTSVAGDKLYLFAENGIGIVMQAGNEAKELARSDLGEEILSSPAFADGRIYLRGKKYLYCLGAKEK